MKNYFKIIILLFTIPFLYACGSSGYADIIGDKLDATEDWWAKNATTSNWEKEKVRISNWEENASSSNSYIDSSEKKAGNASIVGSSGVTYQNIGNITYGSDGTHYQQVGNITYGSDGTHYQQVGNITYGSDGTFCQQVGNFTYCN